jgi:hypothetical protein
VITILVADQNRVLGTTEYVRYYQTYVMFVNCIKTEWRSLADVDNARIAPLNEWYQSVQYWLRESMQCSVNTAPWEDQKGSQGMSENESVSILRRGLSLFRLLYDVRPDM